MILIVTNREDHTADWLILELIARDTKFFRLNTEDLVTDASFSRGRLHSRPILNFSEEIST